MTSSGLSIPLYNAPCLNGSGVPVNGFTNPSQCAGAGFQPNLASNPNAAGSAYYPYFNPVLLPYDLTRGGTLFPFVGHTDVKELAMYVQDTITKRNWTFNLGIRGDLYNGLTTASQAEPRVGISYNIQKTNTVLRVSYARTLETPFNENLVLSSIGCGSAVLNPLLACSSNSLTPLAPGYRNEFHAGLQQAVGRFLVIDGEYIWKYTHNAYDFSVLGNTPITFPIEWHNSKIPGFALRASMPVYHGFSALVVMSSVAARFFTPQLAGAGASPLAPLGVFRIDHDEAYNMTAHLQYQIPVEALTVGWLQLALRQRTGSWSRALLWNWSRQRLSAVDHAEWAAGRDHDRPDGNTPDRRSGISGGIHLQRRACDAYRTAAIYLSGVAVRLDPDPGTDSGNRE